MESIILLNFFDCAHRWHVMIVNILKTNSFVFHEFLHIRLVLVSPLLFWIVIKIFCFCVFSLKWWNKMIWVHTLIAIEMMACSIISSVTSSPSVAWMSNIIGSISCISIKAIISIISMIFERYSIVALSSEIFFKIIKSFITCVLELAHNVFSVCTDFFTNRKFSLILNESFNFFIYIIVILDLNINSR